MNAEANAAMAEIEKRLERPFDPNPPRIHDRPSIASVVRESIPAATPQRNLPALLAELQATIDAVSLDLGLVAGRITEIERFLGIETGG